MPHVDDEQLASETDVNVTTKLLWLAVTPTPYNNFLFGELRRRLGRNFEVVYFPNSDANAPWRTVQCGEWSTQIKGLWGVDWKLCQRVLSDERSTIVFAG